MINITGPFDSYTTSQAVFKQGNHYLSTKPMMCKKLGITFSDDVPDVTITSSGKPISNSTSDSNFTIDYKNIHHEIEVCQSDKCTKHNHVYTNVYVYDDDIVRKSYGNITDVISYHIAGVVSKIIQNECVLKTTEAKYQQQIADLEVKVISLTATNNKLQSEVNRFDGVLNKKDDRWKIVMRLVSTSPIYINLNYVYYNNDCSHN